VMARLSVVEWLLLAFLLAVVIVAVPSWIG
jgi:hypothetical protein